jgi:hypothetical protein
MKWYFALSSATLESSQHDWPNLIRAAVASALKNTRLIPNILWDGPEHQFIDELRQLGVNIIFHRVSFYQDIASFTSSENYHSVAAGCFLRVEIPLIEIDDEYVLYTDADVVFLRDPVPGLTALNPSFLACAPEFEFNDGLNSGVQLINVLNMRKDYPRFKKFIQENLSLGLDQDMYRHYYKDKYERLSPLFNWKPYWGLNDQAYILHWHGIKPVAAKRLIDDPNMPYVPSLMSLLNRDIQSYRYFMDLADSYLSPSPYKITTTSEKYAVILVVRNEVHDILAWLAWYHTLGFDSFIVYDDHSDDGTLDILKQCQKNLDIRIFQTLGVRLGHHQPRQSLSYQHAIAEFRNEFDWMAFFDSDEFLFLSGGSNIKDFLGCFSKADQVCVNWCNYGSSGHYLKPAEPVFEAFTWHGRKDIAVNRHVKSIIRPRAVGPQWINVHCFDVSPDKSFLANGTPIKWSEIHGIIDSNPDWSVAKLMHYQCRSMEHFIERLKKLPEFQGIPGLWNSYDLKDEQDIIPSTFAATVKDVMLILQTGEGGLLEDFWKLRHQAASHITNPNQPISRYKHATQSSVLENALPGGHAGNAGGAVNGRITGARKFHTQEEQNPWWQVDLGGFATIREIHVYNTTDHTAQRCKNLGLSVSIDGESWVELARTPPELVIGDKFSSPYKWHGPGTAWGRYVRVTLMEFGFLHFDQVEVFGTF